jgi:hypothetical protein
MAKLSELTNCFMEAFLKANPNSLVDSNGYLRSEYEAELARRAVPPESGVPDPRTYRPQFECTGEGPVEPFEEFDVNELLPVAIEPISSIGFQLNEDKHIEVTESAPVAGINAPIVPITDAINSTGWKIEQPLLSTSLACVAPEPVSPVEPEVTEELAEPAIHTGLGGKPAWDEPGYEEPNVVDWSDKQIEPEDNNLLPSSEPK